MVVKRSLSRSARPFSRRGECQLQIPATPKSRVDCCRIDRGFCSPVFDELCLSSNRHRAVAPTVPSLLRSCCPLAVAGLVVSVVVDPIDRVLVARSRSHVSVEVSKTTPSRMDGDSSSCVVGVDLAAPSHVLPDVVLCRVAEPVGRVGHLALATPASELVSEEVAISDPELSPACEALTEEGALASCSFGHRHFGEDSNIADQLVFKPSLHGRRHSEIVI
jgi:hypothetical protein